MGVSSKSLDHELVLKPMVTTGNPHMEVMKYHILDGSWGAICIIYYDRMWSHNSLHTWWSWWLSGTTWYYDEWIIPFITSMITYPRLFQVIQLYIYIHIYMIYIYIYLYLYLCFTIYVNIPSIYSLSHEIHPPADLGGGRNLLQRCRRVASLP